MVKKYKHDSKVSYALGTTLTPEFDSDMLKLKIIFDK